MAKFSKEWVERENLNTKWDFSIETEFQKLKEGEVNKIICEGYGITSISDEDDECFVTLESGEVVSFEDLTGITLKKRESYKSLITLFVIILFLWLLTWFILVQVVDEPDERGMFGDMFGSVNALFSGFALAGIIYTIWLQRKELKLQRKELRETRREFVEQNNTMRAQRFENTFFHMLTLHHEIIDKLETTGIFRGKVGSKRAAFETMSEDLEFCISSKLKDENETTEQKESYISKVNSLGEAYDAIKSAYEEFYFKRHEGQLSHYFRSIYHLFKFIYEHDDLSVEDKKRYTSLARAQLSQDELYIHYFNAMYPEMGNPKFLFLIKEMDIMQNFNSSSLDEFGWSERVFQELTSKASDPFSTKDPSPVIISFEEQGEPNL